jgi:homocysteine S-methyltransferase
MGLLEQLLAQPVTILDGGMGSTVEDRGVEVRNALWSCIALLSESGRAINDRVHQDFAEAGAEILIANTHNASLGSSFLFLKEPGLKALEAELADRLRALSEAERPASFMQWLNREAIASARRGLAASGRSAVVAAGIGSAEGAYATESRLSPAAVERRLRPQVEALLSIGVDLVIFETLTTPSEIEGVAHLCARMGSALRFATGFVAREDGNTLAGVSMADAARAFADAPPAIHFVQCTRWDLVRGALDRLVLASPDTAIGAYGNDGRRWVDRRWIGERISPEDYGRAALGWRNRGASVIGGCCGTGPAHIARLTTLIRGS